MIFFTLLFAGKQKNDQYVLLISFDGFRADYLNWYDTPNFDRLGKNGVKAEGLQPVFVTKTFPNHYSIATGMYAENHGLIGNYFFDSKFNEVYQLKDRNKVEDARFYGGEPIWVTAEKQGLRTASYFWVGTEAPIGGQQPSKWKRYDHDFPFEARIDSVLKWFGLPEQIRPRLVLLYFHEPDGTGHRYGPRSSETQLIVESMDRLMGSILTKIKDLDIYPYLNIIVTSDHGMAETSRKRQIPLKEHIDMRSITMEGSGPYSFLSSKSKKNLENTYNILKGIPHLTVYLKNDIPDRWHFKNHYRIKDLLVLADEGWTVVETDHGPSSYMSKGTHGYDNALRSMHAIFLAQGPVFKIDYFSPVINNIDIYPLVAHILRLEPFNGIDGKLDNVQGLLK